MEDVLCRRALMAAAHAAGPIDGTYRGTSNRLRGDTGTCGSETGHSSMTVEDSKFTYVWNPQSHVVVTSTIAPDGSVSGSQQWGRGNLVRVTGHLKGDVLDVTFDSTFCARHFTLTKSG
jgi:hypothetical protein